MKPDGWLDDELEMISGKKKNNMLWLIVSILHKTDF